MLFGLYNGLFVLPMVLSVIGPEAYSNNKDGGDHQDSEKSEEEPLKPIIKNSCEPKNQITSEWLQCNMSQIDDILQTIFVHVTLYLQLVSKHTSDLW